MIEVNSASFNPMAQPKKYGALIVILAVISLFSIFLFVESSTAENMRIQSQLKTLSIEVQHHEVTPDQVLRSLRSAGMKVTPYGNHGQGNKDIYDFESRVHFGGTTSSSSLGNRIFLSRTKVIGRVIIVNDKVVSLTFDNRYVDAF